MKAKEGSQLGPESQEEVLADSFNNNIKAEWLVASAVDDIDNLFGY
jgi:hypothetical protein